MSAMSNYMEEAVVNQFLRGQTAVTPSAVYLALYISDPTDNDTGTEVTGAGYTRVQISFSAPTQSGGKAVTQNANKIDFAAAGGPWGNITHIGVRTAATGGSLLCYAPMDIAKSVNTGDQISFDIGQISFGVN